MKKYFKSFYLVVFGAILLFSRCGKEEVVLPNSSSSTTDIQLRSSSTLEDKVLDLVDYLETQDELSDGALNANLLDTIESNSLIDSLDSLGYLDRDTTESFILDIQTEIENQELTADEFWSVIDSLESEEAGPGSGSYRPPFWVRIFYCRGCVSLDPQCVYILWVRVVGEKGCD